MTAGLRHNGPRLPLPFLGDEVFRNLVLSGVHRADDGLGRSQGDFMLAAAPPVDDCNARFHRIFFPSADMTSSTARSAVRFTSSITGFTSTTSMETICPESQIISMAKCASR